MRRPTPTATSQPFWDSAAGGQLSYPQCLACATWHTYPRPWCSRCLHEPLELAPVSGLGAVYAATIVHRPPAPAFAKVVPYTFALVDLEEGLRVVTMITGCAPDAVHPGMLVEADIDRPSDDEDGAPLIFFTPRTGGREQ
jgi:uncharacterized OB-fold protein